MLILKSFPSGQWLKRVSLVLALWTRRKRKKRKALSTIPTRSTLRDPSEARISIAPLRRLMIWTYRGLIVAVLAITSAPQYLPLRGESVVVNYRLLILLQKTISNLELQCWTQFLKVQKPRPLMLARRLSLLLVTCLL